MLQSDFDTAVAAAKAAAATDGRPITFSGDGPNRPSGAEGGDRSDSQDVLRRVAELLQDGKLDQALALIRQFLGEAGESELPEDEPAALKSVMNLVSKKSVRQALADLQAGPAALEAARRRILAEKSILRTLTDAAKRGARSR
jgi:hypothetical protein